MSKQAVLATISRHLGPVARTLGEHVVLVGPDADDGAWTLVTGGLSDRPMILPDGVAAPRLAELMLRLPASWQLDDAALAEPRWGWPLRWLEVLAALPHAHATWLGDGHTIPNGDPPQPLHPGSPFAGVVLGAPSSLPEGEDVAGEVQIYAVYPLHADEVAFKLARSWDELAERLDAADVTDLVDPERPSSVAGTPAKPTKPTKPRKRR